ncbi:MAG: ATP-binding protein [Formivibrio sp.]|nr:ATP-binding protein [Formivibrio sp.]
MNRPNQKPGVAAALRQRAEAACCEYEQQSAAVLTALSPEAAEQMLHDLRVHQIELEMQNEELRASQFALDVARERYFDLYDLAPIAYCTLSVSGQIVQANLAAANLLGVTREALVGKPLSRFIGNEYADLFYQKRQQLIENGVALVCELRLLNGRNAPTWTRIEGRLAQQADGTPELRVMLIDISERKRFEDERRKSGALQRAIFNSVNFLSVATDVHGVIQVFNVGAQRMLGYPADEVIDKLTPADLCDPQEVIARANALSNEQGRPLAPGLEALVFKASRGIEDIYELTFIRSDGSRFPALVSVTALRDDKDLIIGYLLIGTDNTARKLADAERTRFEVTLLEKNVELENATQLAQKANLAKSEFLSSMSHELRTPLNSILGFAQLLESAVVPPTPGQKKSIDQILKSGWYLLELINEILDLAVIESGKSTLSIEAVSLAAVFEECQAMIEPQAQKYGICVTFTEFATPVLVNVDHMRVKQVLINLLSNAIKYNRVGGTVAVDTVLSGDNAIRISVRDNGEGLTPELIAQLFQPFNRLGRESSDEAGTGIGLVVCKRLIDWMGGTIGVDSTLGVGSVFWFELTLTCDAALG